jgi:hypothetical protein
MPTVNFYARTSILQYNRERRREESLETSHRNINGLLMQCDTPRAGEGNTDTAATAALVSLVVRSICSSHALLTCFTTC